MPALLSEFQPGRATQQHSLLASLKATSALRLGILIHLQSQSLRQLAHLIFTDLCCVCDFQGLSSGP